MLCVSAHDTGGKSLAPHSESIVGCKDGRLHHRSNLDADESYRTKQTRRWKDALLGINKKMYDTNLAEINRLYRPRMNQANGSTCDKLRQRYPLSSGGLHTVATLIGL